MESFDQAVRRHLMYSLSLAPAEVGPRDLLHAAALAVRDRMTERRLQTEQLYGDTRAKRLYYLSMEFLIGRSLVNNLTNIGLLEEFRAVAAEFGLDPTAVEESEVDAALGNGGLGRLAACYLDSLATLGYPGFGYGINYEFGLFRQEIRNGRQVEAPDSWRTYDSPWLIERPRDAIIVPIYGRIEHARDRKGNYSPMWLDWKVVIGVPHDMAVVGYGGKTVNVLRLFSARASSDVDMSTFNEGDYIAAAHDKVTSETISKVLYPSEAGRGRELRLIQEYFLTACSVRDIVRRYQQDHSTWDQFADQVAIQLNDTHPTLAIAELMRIFIDENDLTWNSAWALIEQAFGYTNHTLLPEALEKWPVDLLERVLPRHLQIIYEINHRFLQEVEQRWPGDTDRLRRMSMIEEGPTRQVRMAHLAIAASHAVNGVSALHSLLVQQTLVPDFAELWPHKFTNVTNGVTPRRWLLSANHELAMLISLSIGPKWVAELDRLRDLERFTDDRNFRDKFRAIKRRNKERLAGPIRDATGIAPDLDALFDVQVKRIHEYKRQLLNLLHVVYMYVRALDGEPPSPPRVVVFAGKAAPGYRAAKEIIRLIHEVARVINSDPRMRGWLQVAYLPDYRVTLAEKIIPAADLSEQISTAGTEASGTGNMKFALNGALTIGTLDGANIEMREQIGDDDFFIFGLNVDQAHEIKARGYRPRVHHDLSPAVQRVIAAFRDNLFCPEHPGAHQWVVDKLLADGEQYLHLADLASYIDAQTAVSNRYRDSAAWTTSAIRNVARMGYFSSDRAIHEYAERIWKLPRPDMRSDEWFEGLRGMALPTS